MGGTSANPEALPSPGSRDLSGRGDRHTVLVETTPDQHREVLVLSRRSSVRMLGLGAVMVAASVFVSVQVSPVGWFAVALFGLCTLLAVLRLIKPPTLELGQDGFTMHATFPRVRTRSWAQCTGFVAWRAGVFYRTTLTSKPRWWRRANRALGGDESIPVGFGGLPGTELADLMNRHGQPWEPSSLDR